ncbi:formyltransferase [Propionivibrio sp.]|uniref:formyltransferase n=1 Tax=Propionivibrio sp. TaxID=2212460 RepID=UPI002607EB4C|nr:formyltransferase [Propionivibrio sp.]
MSSAVVFAYHNVGVRCLCVLLAGGVDVRLVVTHEDNPQEHIWFASVRQLCIDNNIPCITPSDPNTPEVEAQVAALGADFLFSFYYRHMLRAPLLQAVRRGAYNLHGSLLPKYRGRAPVNWAVLRGERETGATLHQMNVKPDNGPIIDQFAVPILPDDTAQEVFVKVTVAAELCLYRTLPQLLAGTALHRQQDLSQGAYFGGRQAEDGRIDWRQNARQIHNLVRAVSRPYPGAFSDFPAGRLILWRTRVLDELSVSSESGTLQQRADRIEIHPAGGGVLHVLEAELAGSSLRTTDDWPLPLPY